MQLPKPSGNDFAPTPAGTFLGICYRFIDRGTQQSEYMGEKKTRHEVMLSWELAGEFMEDGRPFTASKTYTWSMSEKATLRKDLEAWRGRNFTDDDFDGPNAFNTKKLLGVPCTLTIVHEEKNGNTFAKVASIGKVMKGMEVPPLSNPTVYLGLTPETWSPETYATLSDKMREVIARSPEYQKLLQKNGRHDDPGHGNRRSDFDDDIPF